MITNLTVRGFRSLLNFSTELRSGINVLVGPNGSGKTNVVRFLDFLSNLVGGGLPLAFDKAGGAVQVFSEEILSGDNPTFDFEIRGAISTDKPLDSMFIFGSDKEPQVDCDSYHYCCEITYSKEMQAVYIGRERLSLIYRGINILSFDRITRGKSGQTKAFKTTVESTPADTVLHAYAEKGMMHTGDEALDVRIGRQVGPERSILHVIDDTHTLFMRVLHSLTSLSSININPDAARSAMSVSDTTVMSDTGRGLTSILSRLKRKQYYPYSDYRRQRRILSPDQQAVAFKSILNWVEEVNPDIQDIHVWPDTFSATLRAEITMKIDGVIKTFSFDKVSDGTIKWIALVTILFVSPNYSAIEEPENFLHPRMQETFVALLRDQVSADRSVIITTHSESLLNVCSPSELLVFRFGANGTEARRPANQAQLNKALQQGRFRLGHYYRTGAIDA